MSLCKPQNSKILNRKLDDTDRRTDGPTDQRADSVLKSRVHATKKWRKEKRESKEDEMKENYFWYVDVEFAIIVQTCFLFTSD